MDEALRFIKVFKAYGPDRFQSFCFKDFWHILGNDVCRVVWEAFLVDHFDERLAETLTILIPKVDVPLRMAQFRLISLCNIVYKLITKVLVNRLHPFLTDLIESFQNNFIPGGGKIDNVIIAQEILHYMA